MVLEPIRGVNKDQSRLKSLYFLLQATAKLLPLSNFERTLLNKAMPFLTIQSSDEKWIISFSELHTASTIVPKTNFNFYRHSDDTDIARDNKIEATKVLITLFPELHVHSIILKGQASKKTLWASIAKRTIPNLLLLLLLVPLNEFLLFRISALSVIPIILFRIESVKVQILLIGNALLITNTFSESANLYQFFCLIFFIIYSISLELSLLASTIKAYYRISGQIIIAVSMVINLNLRLDIIFAILLSVLVIRLISRRYFKVTSGITLLLFLGAILSYMAVTLLGQTWYLVVLRFFLILPSFILLTLRNRSTGLTPYLVTFIGLLTV